MKVRNTVCVPNVFKIYLDYEQEKEESKRFSYRPNIPRNSVSNDDEQQHRGREIYTHTHTYTERERERGSIISSYSFNMIPHFHERNTIFIDI